jgi:hypothetical protein
MVFGNSMPEKTYIVREFYQEVPHEKYHAFRHVIVRTRREIIHNWALYTVSPVLIGLICFIFNFTGGTLIHATPETAGEKAFSGTISGGDLSILSEDQKQKLSRYLNTQDVVPSLSMDQMEKVNAAMGTSEQTTERSSEQKQALLSKLKAVMP